MKEEQKEGKTIMTNKIFAQIIIPIPQQPKQQQQQRPKQPPPQQQQQQQQHWRTKIYF